MSRCGPDRIRTGDLSIANAALYQLSYRPVFGIQFKFVKCALSIKKPRLRAGLPIRLSTRSNNYTATFPSWVKLYGWLFLMKDICKLWKNNLQSVPCIYGQICILSCLSNVVNTETNTLLPRL